MKILITRRIHQDAVDLLRKYIEIDYVEKNEPLSRQFLLENLRNYTGVLSCVSEKFDSELLDSAKDNLRVISNMAVGLDNIDLVKAKEFGILVYNTPGVVTDSTADLTICLALALIRKINLAQKYIQENKWIAWDPEIFLGRTLKSLKWGIVGFGQIGQAVAKRLYGFGVDISYYDPQVDIDCLNGYIKVNKTTFEDILVKSDIVSLHIPLNNKTEHLFNIEKFKQMKKSAYLINIARGGVVNTSDLILALKTKEIARAALDVFDPEPLQGNHEIFNFDNVLITPHIGTATLECRKEMALMAAKNILKFFKFGK